jgi:branched-chain amino acid transport system permease protein
MGGILALASGGAGAWVNAIVQGILLGGLYALLATGLSLSFGVMRFVNLAHGDVAVLSAFMAFSTARTFHVNPLFALLLVIPGGFVLGLLVQRYVFDRLIGGDPSLQIVATFGLSIVIQNALWKKYTADTRGLKIGKVATRSIRVNDAVAIGWLPLITFLCGVGVLAGLALFLKRTRLGRAFRATSDDPAAAQLMGIDNRRIYGVATAIAMATVALAGILIGSKSSFDPFLGPANLIFAFEAVVIGGLGSLWGTLAGGIALGVAQAIGLKLDAGWGELAGHVVFLAVLAFRPTGMFGKLENR